MLPSARLVAQLQRRAVNLFYGDSACLLVDVPTGTYDEYNQPIVVESEIPFDCSFTDGPATERWAGYADIEELVAEIRFASPTPTKGNRIRLTGHFGEDEKVSPNMTYEIIGIRERGIFGYVCALKKVSV